ncbi:MAG TPA: ATP-dependent DNA helicase RecG [Kofleriaceae bacterium]|nr:ATP-dependent DNA helicase RecG [Kofleriaceae bacterium]
MDAELKRRVEALRRPLELAAQNDFAGVRRVQGLGNVLRVACDGLLQKWASEQLAAWRVILAKWEQLGVAQQEAEVARGMRLIARLPSAPSAKPVAQQSEKPKAEGPAAPGPERVKAAKAAPDVATTDPLSAPTHSLPGIGPAFAERLAEKNLETVEDLLWCLPRRYDDVRDAKPLAEVAAMAEGMRATFSAKVASSRMVFVRGRRWAEVRLGAVDITQPATAVVRWFNVWAGIEKRMPAGAVVTLSGVVKKRNERLELANPDILAIDLADAQLPLEANGGGGAAKVKKPPPTIIPRYPEVQGVPASKLRVACQTACARVGASADDGVPKSIELASGMPTLAETLARLHDPPSDISVEDLASLNRGDSPWQRRLAFGELFALGVAVAMRRKERRADAAVPCARTPGLDEALAKALPFRPTNAQQRAFREMGDDLVRATPMNRLLQGDVGAGKTAVAFAAALHVAKAGRQVAVMAPTELLAEQHFETWKKWAAATGLRVELLTASTQKGVRQSLLALLAAGKLDVVIGTHSLIAEAVGFAALGLVVIDEQHRFGVAQRAKLRDKGDGQGAPHLLVMTATPIPRTLALTAYGDLDVSILDELPPGREPAKTKIVAGKRGEQAAYKLIAERVAAGERAYVVCPKVEDDPESDNDWKDATTVASEMSAALPQLRVGLVHGRIDSQARDRVMRAFKQGELDVLVATTVIEVGVDVPSATVMVIHDAERFGLAQLHQLRGRVGRGGGVAHCVLVTGGSISEDGRRRLDAMVRTTDGFLIAEEDLALRGPGELLGPKQAGVPRLRFGDLAQHTELLLEARGHAERILDEDPGLVRPEHAALRAALARRVAQSVYGAESG